MECFGHCYADTWLVTLGRKTAQSISEFGFHVAVLLSLFLLKWQIGVPNHSWYFLLRGWRHGLKGWLQTSDLGTRGSS